MTDVFDQASIVEQRDTAAALDAQKQAAAAYVRPAARGYCLNPKCGEDFAPGDAQRLFCNAQCAADYQRFKR